MLKGETASLDRVQKAQALTQSPLPGSLRGHRTLFRMFTDVNGFPSAFIQPPGDSLYLGVAEGASWKAVPVRPDPYATTPVAAGGGKDWVSPLTLSDGYAIA
jgi:hypothetical protein